MSSSSYQNHTYTQPREDAIRVYRCENHWHFFLDKHKHTPWYQRVAPSPTAKYPANFTPIYTRDTGSELYTVEFSYESRLYSLRAADGGRVQVCPDIYRGGVPYRQLWREEDLKETPWGGNGGESGGGR